MYAARQALERFLFQLMDPNDEVFLYRFDNAPNLVEGWTRDKRRISEALGRIQPRGSTSLYDAVADAVVLAQQGHNRKKAVVILSDGNDTSSHTDIFAVKQLIRETEVLVYAIGIDSAGSQYVSAQWPQRGAPPRPIPMPFPMPGGKKPPSSPPPPVPQPPAWPDSGRRRERRWRLAPAGTAPRTTVSTSRRFATSPTTAAAAPRSSAGCATSIPRSRALQTS